MQLAFCQSNDSNLRQLDKKDSLKNFGGPARIRLKTTANPPSRFETLADSHKFGGFLDAAPYRYLLKLVFLEFACSEVQNRWDLNRNRFTSIFKQSFSSANPRRVPSETDGYATQAYETARDN